MAATLISIDSAEFNDITAPHVLFMTELAADCVVCAHVCLYACVC